MALPKIYFTGFNGFGQFKNLPKIVTAFEEIQLESIATAFNGIRIKCMWNYCAYANGSDLFIGGCLNAKIAARRHFPFEYDIKDVACAETYCLVLLTIGTAYKINCNNFDISEINATIIQRSSLGDEVKTSPIFGEFSAKHENELNERKDEFITHIAAGRTFSVAITNKNNVYNMPMKIHTFPSHVKIKKISCGNEHCLILTTNGDLYAFGSSTRGQLGLGELNSEETPVLIEALAGIKIIDVAAGGWHSAAISAFNDLYVWGWNVNGQLGLPLFKTFQSIQTSGEIRNERQKCATVFASPVIIDLPKQDNNGIDDGDDDDDGVENMPQSQHHPVAVSAGTRHTVIKIDDGTIMATGWNKYGQLASTQLDDDFDRFHIINKIELNEFQLICGEWSTFIISTD